MLYRQQIIRDFNYNIIEYIDNNTHIKYNTMSDIIYYKSDNFILPPLLNSIESDKEEKFFNLIKDSIIKIDEDYPSSIYLFKNDKCLFEYKLGIDVIWFDYSLIWSIFGDNYCQFFLLGKIF